MGGQRHSHCLGSEYRCWISFSSGLQGFFYNFWDFVPGSFGVLERLAVMYNTAVSFVGYEKVHSSFE